MNTTLAPLRARLLCAAAAVCVPAMLLGGCGHPAVTNDGPAVVSVTKAPVVAPDGGQDDLDRLSPDAVPGAAEVEWGSVARALWLPESVRVSEGPEDSTAQSGWVYLDVPADYQVTAATVVTAQQRLDPATAISAVEDPVGTVLSRVLDGTTYTMSLTPDPEGKDGFSVAMIRWAPAPEATPAP